MEREWQNRITLIASHRIANSIIALSILTTGLAQAQTKQTEYKTTLIKVIQFSTKSPTQRASLLSTASPLEDPAPPVLSSTTGAPVIVLSDYAPPGYPIPPAPTQPTTSSEIPKVTVNGHYICSTEDGYRIYSNYCGWPWPYEGGVGGTSGGEPGGGPSGGGGGGGYVTTPVKTAPNATSSCLKALAKSDRTDKELVRKAESYSTVGYTLLPVTKFPNSGVTIGYGVDLGSKSEADLQRWGMSSEGIAAVKPYLGLRGSSAVRELAKHPDPPEISNDDAIAISDGVYKDILTSTIREYDQKTTTGVSFQELPAGAQAAIMDIAYIGKPSIKAPEFWSKVINGEWSAAASELTNWYGNGKTDARHLHDAKLIADAIMNKELAEKTSGKCK